MNQQTKTLSLKYHATLASLFALVTVVVGLPEQVFSLPYLPLIALGLFAVLILLARKLARRLSRDTSTDSVLIFRYWLLSFWVVLFTIGVINQIIHFSEATAITNYVTHAVILGIIGLNVFGIYIHGKKKPTIVKNLKKDDLFQ